MFKVHEFQNLRVATDFLNGALVGGPVPLGGLSLAGKTITFTKPAFSCTFTVGSGPDSGRLFPADIKSQLETASTNELFVTFDGSRIILRETAPTTGVELNAAVEEAKTMLGLSPSAAGQRVYSQSSSSYPRLVATQSTPSSVIFMLSSLSAGEEPEQDSLVSSIQGTGIAPMSAAADSGQIGTGATTLGTLLLTNIGSTDVFIQFFDAAALPADATASDYEFPLAAGQTLQPDFRGTVFSTGCFWASSSTSGVKTITALTSVRVGEEEL